MPEKTMPELGRRGLVLLLAIGGVLFAERGSTLPSAAVAPDRPIETPGARVFGDQVSVALVNVDLYVTAKGRPVPGLSREDLRLLVDGRPVEITHFGWQPPLEETDGATAVGRSRQGEPVHVGIFLDDAQIGERDRKPMLESLDRALAAVLGPDDRVTVARFDGAEIEILLEASDDRSRLRKALDELRWPAPRQMMASQELRDWVDAITESIAPPEMCNHTGVYLKALGEAVRSRATTSAAALVRFADRLPANGERRFLLHVSDGLPAVAGGELWQWAREMCDGTALLQGIPGAVSTFFDSPAIDGNTRDRWDVTQGDLESTEYNLGKLWEDVAARLNAFGVTLYPVQVGDASSRIIAQVPGQNLTASSLAAVRENSRGTLSVLAAETGGLYLDATVGSARIDRMTRDLGGYYSLAFVPPASKGSGASSIRIELDRPGVDLRYRKSFRFETQEERIASRLNEIWASLAIENPLGIRLTMANAAAADRSRLRVEIPLGDVVLVDLPGLGRVGRLTLFLAVRDRSGDVKAVRKTTLPLSVPGSTPSFHACEIELPEGAREVAVAILDEQSGTTSYARRSSH